MSDEMWDNLKTCLDCARERIIKLRDVVRGAERICQNPRCAQPFIAEDWRQKYCGIKCRSYMANHSATAREQRRVHKRKRRAGLNALLERERQEIATMDSLQIIDEQTKLLNDLKGLNERK